jgi:hypothetical protein
VHLDAQGLVVEAKFFFVLSSPIFRPHALISAAPEALIRQ